MADDTGFHSTVQEYIEALQEGNILGAINSWNALERRYATGSEPGTEHKVVYEYATDTLERVPSLPLTALVKEYNSRVAEKQHPDLNEQEREEQDWQQEILLDTMDDQFTYFGTVSKSFYEQGGRLFMLDESVEPPVGDSSEISEIDTITDGVKLEDLMEQYSLLQRYRDIDWHQSFETAERVRDVARELYHIGENEDTELLYDGQSAYTYNRIEDTFEPVREENLERLQDTEAGTTLFEAFDLSGLEEMEE